MSESFTAKDIVSIISACHKNRVRKLKLGDLTLRFDLEPEEIELSPSFVEPEATEIEQAIRQQDPFVAELEKQTLLMEDPAAYERMLMDEHKEAMADAVQAERSEHDVYRVGHIT